MTLEVQAGTITRFTLDKAQTPNSYKGASISEFEPDEIYEVKRSPDGGFDCIATSMGTHYKIDHQHISMMLLSFPPEKIERIKSMIFSFVPVYIRIRDKTAKTAGGKTPNHDNYLFPPEDIHHQLFSPELDNDEDQGEGLAWWLHQGDQ